MFPLRRTLYTGPIIAFASLSLNSPPSVEWDINVWEMCRVLVIRFVFLPTAANPTRGYYVNLYLDYGRCETTVTDFRQLVGNLYYYNNNIQAA